MILICLQCHKIPPPICLDSRREEMNRMHLFLKLPLEFLAELTCILQLGSLAWLASQGVVLLFGTPALLLVSMQADMLSCGLRVC